MISINLLPKQGHIRKTMLMIVLAFLLIALLFQLIMTFENQRLTQKLILLRASAGKGTAESTIKLPGLQKDEFAQLPKQIESLKKELTSLEKQVTLLERNRVADQWIEILSMIVGSLPETIWFTRMEIDQSDILFVEAKGVDYNDILHWVDTLDSLITQPGKSHVRYLQMQQEIQFGVEIWMDGDAV